jgi:hypothetical protein
MPERITEVHEEVAADPTGVTRTQSVATTSSERKFVKAERVIYLILTIVEVLFGLRLILALLGANASNGFAEFIYGITHPFVAPFFSLFGYTFQSGVSYFEIGTVVAMVVYALVAWIIVKVINIYWLLRFRHGPPTIHLGH